MKQETIQRLKRYSKIGQYIVISLCWLMALLGVTAYSVYWLRQNANYEQETASRLLSKKLLSNNDYISYWNLKPENFEGYNDLNYRDGSYKNYFELDQGSYGVITYSYEGDFKIRDNDTLNDYTSIRFYFSDIDADTFRLSSVRLDGGLHGNSKYLYQYNSVYTSSIIVVGRFSVSLQQHVYDVVENGVFNYYFNEIYNTLDSSTIHINSGVNNATNFLLTYNRMNYSMGVYQVNYNLQMGYKLVIPLDFVSNNELFDAIVIFPQYCYSYINNNGVKVDNYGNGYTIDQMPFITSFIGYQYRGQTMTASKTPNDVIGGVTNTYETYNSFSGGVIAGQMLLAGYIQVEIANITSNYPVFDLRRGIQINEFYSDITFKTNMLGSKVPNNWWIVNGGGTAPFTLPLDNITYSDFFTYFNYNGPVDYVINVTTDVGLQNVFVLIKDAFGGLTGLLAIQVLPGLTLGLLVFMPFLVGLIIVIIRLVKK